MIAELLAKLRRPKKVAPEPAERTCSACQLRIIAVQSLDHKLRCASGAQRRQDRRIKAFADDHPELHRLYFTKAGDAERAGDEANA